MPTLKRKAPKRRFLRRPAVINAAPSSKMPMSAVVARSNRRYATLRSSTPRFTKRQDKAVATAGIAMYNTSVGNKASMANLHQGRAQGTFSNVPRFKPSTKPDGPANSIHLNAGLADAVTASARRYAIMRSATPRFRRRSMPAEAAHLGPGYVDVDDTRVRKRPQSARIGRSPRFVPGLRGGAPDVQYNVDQGTKSSMATAVARSQRQYSVMAKGSKRFQHANQHDHHLEEALANVDYDTDRGRQATIGKRLQESGNPFRIVFENTSPRFSGNGGDSYLRQALSSVDYDTDVAHKQTLATQTARSRSRYASMVSTTRRFESDGAGRGAGQQLGPASMDVNMAAVEPHRPQPIISTTERFKTHRDPTKNLGGTYRPSHDAKYWGKGGLLSTTTRPPMAVPSAVDKVFDVDSGHRMSLSTAVNRSPRRYSNVRSATSRDVAPVAFTANDPRLVSAKETCGAKLGPGAHNPQVMKNGFFNTISRRDDWNRATPSFASHTGRFGGTMQGDDGGGAGHAAVPRRPASAKPKSAISRRKAGRA